MSSKIVEIHKYNNLAHENTKGAKDFMEQAKVSIGSYYHSVGGKATKKTATGLSFEEIDLLMPLIIDYDESDREFRKEVTRYFDAIDNKVPLTLEVGLKDNSKELGIDLNEGVKGAKPKLNLPLNVEDYIVFNHAKGHPHVALSEDEAIGNYFKSMYIVDDSKIEEELLQDIDISDKALALYIQNKDKKDIVLQALSYLGVSLVEPITGKKLSPEAAFKAQATKNPKNFIKCIQDEDLPYVAKINSYVKRKIVRREGNRYIFENKVLGASTKDFVEWLKDKSNSETIIILKARLDDYNK
jgi:hypothetical protein